MPIRHHKTEIDKDKNFREYIVVQADTGFDFIYMEWNAGDNGINHGVQKIRTTFQNEEDAVAEYDKFIAAWET